MNQQTDSSHQSHGHTTNDRFGVVAAVAGAILYAVAIVFFVLPLADKIDAFFIVSYLFVPAIVGGILYDNISRAGGWE